MEDHLYLSTVDNDVSTLIQSLVGLLNKNKVAQEAPRERWVTKKTAAQMLDCSLRTVERYIETGKLTKHVRGKNRVVVPFDEVQALVE